MASIFPPDDLPCDKEFVLSVPPGCQMSSVLVNVELEPATGSCVIYGIKPDGHTEGVEVHGGHSQITLPFAHPKIYVKHSADVTDVRIGTIGHQ